MNSGYHYNYPGYRYSSVVNPLSLSSPTLLNPPDDLFYDFESDGYYQDSKRSAFQLLEDAREQYEHKKISLSKYFNATVALLKTLDTSVPVFRKAGAIIRYLPIDILDKVRDNHVTALLLEKLIHYFYRLDWTNLLKALEQDRDTWLFNGSGDTNKEKENDNYSYAEAALQQTRDYEKRTRPEQRTFLQVCVSSGTPTSKTRTRRSAGTQSPPSTPEKQILPICPTLANLR